MKYKVIYIIVSCLAGIAIFLAGLSINLPKDFKFDNQTAGQIKETTKTVSVLIDNGNLVKSFTEVKLPVEPNVLTVLKQITTENNLRFDYDSSSPMGSFIKQIGDKINGTDNKYWQYWVNGIQPLVAADKFKLSGGEIILWAFTGSEF